MTKIRTIFATTAAIFLATTSVPVQAMVIFNLIDFVPEHNPIPFDAAFVATAPVMTFTIGGYGAQPEYVVGQSIAGGLSGNLLSENWDFTVPQSGLTAYQLEPDDPSSFTGPKDLVFTNPVKGAYDYFSQTISTTVGTEYFYSFVLEGNLAAPNGLIVTVEPAVPEAATWVMLVAGFGAMGVALRRRRAMTTATLAA